MEWPPSLLRRALSLHFELQVAILAPAMFAYLLHHPFVWVGFLPLFGLFVLEELERLRGEVLVVLLELAAMCVLQPPGLDLHPVRVLTGAFSHYGGPDPIGFELLAGSPAWAQVPYLAAHLQRGRFSASPIFLLCPLGV